MFGFLWQSFRKKRGYTQCPTECPKQEIEKPSSASPPCNDPSLSGPKVVRVVNSEQAVAKMLADVRDHAIKSLIEIKGKYSVADIEHKEHIKEVDEILAASITISDKNSKISALIFKIRLFCSAEKDLREIFREGQHRVDEKLQRVKEIFYKSYGSVGFDRDKISKDVGEFIIKVRLYREAMDDLEAFFGDTEKPKSYSDKIDEIIILEHLTFDQRKLYIVECLEIIKEFSHDQALYGIKMKNFMSKVEQEASIPKTRVVTLSDQTVGQGFSI